MKALLLALLVAAAGPAAAAPAATGAPGSPACGQALQQLRELEDRVLAAPRDRAEAARRQMLQARRSAALACLGESDAAEGPRAPRVELPPARPRDTAPLTVPSTRPPSLGTPSRATAPSLPRTLGSCDSNGCWTSDGVRLQKVGPQLLGPRGFCSTAGNAVQCP